MTYATPGRAPRWWRPRWRCAQQSTFRTDRVTAVMMTVGTLLGGQAPSTMGECLIAPSVQPLVTRTAPPDSLESYAAATPLARSWLR